LHKKDEKLYFCEMTKSGKNQNPAIISDMHISMLGIDKDFGKSLKKRKII
jgi:uncharacterized pyridoxamine 5'-phosphate oxidase family protein